MEAKYVTEADGRIGAARAHGADEGPDASTLILQVSNVQPDAEVHRHMGVTDAATFAELHKVLGVVFGLDASPEEASPWHFYCVTKRINPEHRLRDFLRREGDTVQLQWGLWEFTLSVAEVYPRDAGTPRALCVGGSGSFPGTRFDLTGINAALTGEETISEVLRLVRPEVRSVIERSRLYDFVPLLQALDLARPVDPALAQRVSGLPREVTELGRDAFWCVVLALACLGEETLTAHVAATTMEALGWVEDDGSAISAMSVREYCPASVERLLELRACGPDQLSALDRLDIYRALLRK